MKKCPECNFNQDFNNSYCCNCGFKFDRISLSKQIKCPECNTVQYIKNNYCVNCGHDLKSLPQNIFDLIKRMECPNCKRNIPKDSAVCPYCNFDLTNQQQTPNEESVEGYKNCPNCNEKVEVSCNICPKCNYDFTIKNKKTIKPPHVSKLLKFKRNAIFLSNYDFNIKLCPKCNSKLFLEDSFCYNCSVDVVNAENPMPNEPKISKFLKFKRNAIFLSNYDFNIKLCPKCNSKLLLWDSFCYNCGEKVISNDATTPEKPIVATEDSEPVENAPSKSNYKPDFKMAYTLYLDEFRKNSKRDLSEKITKKYNTTLNKLKKQALSDNFIELETPLMVAENLKLSEIKKVLKMHDLKVSGKKEELIERLGQNLSEEELNKDFKPKNYFITDKGLMFLKNNNYLLYVHKNSEVSQAISPKECIDLFDEREYSNEEIYGTLINYFNNKFVDELNHNKWDDFKEYSNAIASLLKDQGNLGDALVMRFKIFLFDINNYSVELQKPSPGETKLKSKDINKLVDLIIKLNQPLEEVMKLFAISCDEFIFKRVISDEDSWKYLAKILDGDDLKEVSKEINEDYSHFD